MNARDDDSYPWVTICVTAFGNYPQLIRRLLDSIESLCPREQFRLNVGGNALRSESKQAVENGLSKGLIDEAILSSENLHKCPMMRRLFHKIETPYVWWFDDDSYFTKADAMDHWRLRARNASERTVIWGKTAFISCPPDVPNENIRAMEFVRSASWYCGLTPPSWEPGGKSEFNFEGRGGGDGRWFFSTGGSWLIRTSAIRTLAWPDERLIIAYEDVFLGEAIRQRGWAMGECDYGIAISDAKRRWS